MRGRARGAGTQARRGEARPGEADAADAATAQVPPPPLAEQGGLGPEGGGAARKGRAPTPGRWQPQGTEVGGAEQGEGGPRPGLRSLGSRLLPHAPPARGPVSQGAHRPDTGSRSFEASAPEERAPPSPRPPRPPRAWQTLVPSRAGAGG